MTNIRKTEAFLREQFANCTYYKEHPADGEYRLQHSYRVAHAAGEIARREGLDQEGLIIGGLLHDVGYSLPFEREDSWVWSRSGCRRYAMALQSMWTARRISPGRQLPLP